MQSITLPAPVVIMQVVTDTVRPANDGSPGGGALAVTSCMITTGRALGGRGARGAGAGRDELHEHARPVVIMQVITDSVQLW